MKKAYLILEDGHVFEGYSFGAEAKCIGELVFNTQAVGYIETLTDPSYYGQIVMQTFPMIGNYGVIEEDFVGKCSLSGYVVREYCEKPSNFRCQYDIDAFLKKNNIPGIKRELHFFSCSMFVSIRQSEYKKNRTPPTLYQRPDQEPATPCQRTSGKMYQLHPRIHFSYGIANITFYLVGFWYIC